MIVRGITIRSKLIITTAVTVGIMLTLSLVIFNASSRLSSNRELLKERSEMLSQLRKLEYSFFAPDQAGSPLLNASLIQNARQLETGISQIISHPTIAGEEPLLLAARQIEATIESFVNSQGWENAKTELVVLGRLIDNFNDELSQEEFTFSSKQNKGLAITLILGITGIILILGFLTYNLSRSLSVLIQQTRKISGGGLPPPISLPHGDELKQVADHLNKHTSDLQDKISYLSSLSGEGPVSIYAPQEEDEVGNALVVLSNYLNRKELDEASRNREDRKQNWISAGNAQIGEVLRSERENVAELSFSIIQKLVSYMKVEMGSLFISNHSEPDHPTLELTASYAYDRRKYQNRILEWGSELPGTCAQERKKILLTEVPEHYFEVSSGTGSARPNCLLLVPMIIDDIVYGVIELATVRLLRTFEIEFVESLSTGIATSLEAVQNNERTSALLKQSRSQEETSRTQEVLVQEKLKEMEAALADSLKKESDNAGLLQAVSQSTLVAELGLNGRYVSINQSFLMLLESQSDQVLGKLYTEFSQADPSSNEYKEFWSSLRAGDSISNTERYKLFSGKEVWLKQSFTPLVNDEGKVYKIINIAEDVTEAESLKDRLKSRENDLTRAGLDFQTLNDAVNIALIKCELDPDGIIMQVNDKYAEITGYSRKELLGRNYRLFLKESEKEQFEKIWTEVAKQKVYEGVIRRTRPTGEEAWLVSTFSPVIDESGVIYKIYFMAFDITEKKLKYQLLEDANREIERLKQELKNYETG